MIKNIIIEGMSCEHCVKHVTEALEEVNGVNHVEVDLKIKTATIEGTKEVQDVDLKSAIEEVGYEVVSIV